MTDFLKLLEAEMEALEKDSDDPCQDGYVQLGMKKKNGREVPNCVPKNEQVTEAEYQGRKVTLDKPFRLDGDGDKKFGVYVKDGDKVKMIKFGSSSMDIRRDNDEARKSFRARHKCDQQKDKTSAAYWACFMWQKGKSVSDILD